MTLRYFVVSIFLFVVSFSSHTVSAEYSQKISPDVFNAFDTKSLTDQFSPASIKSQGEQVRVIIKLKDTLKSFNTAMPFSISEIIQRNLNLQNKFIESLKQNGLFKTYGQNGFSLATKLKLQNSVAGYLPSLEVANLIAARNDVVSIEIDKLNKLFTVEGRMRTGSDVVAASGYTGKDVGIAIIDSHFDLLHEELGGSTTLPNGVVFAGENFSDPGESVHSHDFASCYHGTGTASIARRYAPDSGIYALTVFPNAYDSVIANAINWVIENKDGVAGGPPIKVISMSLGAGRNYSTCNTGIMHEAAETALENGVLVIAASGNDGYTNAIASPACSDNIISIGSVWDEDNANYEPFSPANCIDNERSADEKTCYSNMTSFLDLYAPSEEVECAQCGGGTWTLGGTSSATPAAAGMTAQILQFKPDLSLDKDNLVATFHNTGVQVIGDEDKRRIDLVAAIGNFVTHPPIIEAINITTEETVVTIAINVSDSDADLDKIYLYVDGSEHKAIDVETDGPTATVTHQIDYALLDAGEHCIRAYAADVALNQSEWSDEKCFIAPDVPKNPPTIDSIEVSANGLFFTVTGTASDPDNNLSYVQIDINDSGNWITVDGQEAFSYSSPEMDEGTYTVKARAIDTGNLYSFETEPQYFEITFDCKQYTSSNSEHKASGRAYTKTSGWWWYATTTWYTNGSDENLGTSGSDETTLKETPKGYFSVGKCPSTQPVAPSIIDYSYDVQDLNLTITGKAIDDNNDIKEVIASVVGVGVVICDGTTDFTCSFTNLEPGPYNVTIEANDSSGLSSKPIVFDLEVKNTPVGDCITATNYDHVEEGRAYSKSVWYVANAYANGSDDHMGYTGSVWYSATSSLQEESSGYWVVVDSCN
ncbi:MAG: hypothetical protein D6B28_04570 [Gammaproteobacteria bacterium]|nr:MAG: hypothetical protein D6B28_04570 [Gammaproteobacteria bacterium]